MRLGKNYSITRIAFWTHKRLRWWLGMLLRPRKILCSLIISPLEPEIILSLRVSISIVDLADLWAVSPSPQTTRAHLITLSPSFKKGSTWLSQIPGAQWITATASRHTNAQQKLQTNTSRNEANYSAHEFSFFPSSSTNTRVLQLSQIMAKILVASSPLLASVALRAGKWSPLFFILTNLIFCFAGFLRYNSSRTTYGSDGLAGWHVWRRAGARVVVATKKAGKVGWKRVRSTLSWFVKVANIYLNGANGTIMLHFTLMLAWLGSV